VPESVGLVGISVPWPGNKKILRSNATLTSKLSSGSINLSSTRCCLPKTIAVPSACLQSPKVEEPFTSTTVTKPVKFEAYYAMTATQASAN
jgi:hypothetical protein